jgi:flagellar protein FliL
MSAKPEAKEEGGKKKKPLPLIIGIVVLVVALFVGKTVMAKGKDAKEGTKKSKSSKSSKHHDDDEDSHGKKKKKSHDDEEDEEHVKVGHSLQLDEFLVNLQGAGDHYLKASLALGLKEGLTEEKAKELVPMARDIIIASLSEKSIKDLSSNKGRDELKDELLEKINEEAGEEADEPVVKIYITAFATQ